MANVIVMERLLDLFEWSEQRGMVSESHSSLFTSCSFAQASHLASDAATQTDMNGSNVLSHVLSYGENTTGCFDNHTKSKAGEDYFIASTDATRNLLCTMASYNGTCPLCGFLFDMESFSFLRHGHAVRISLNCAAGHSLRWYSSSITTGKFTVNLRMIHGFTCTGLTETQYVNYCKASNIGHVEEKYISTAAQQPGIVKVLVYSQSKRFLGETDFQYSMYCTCMAVQHGIEGFTKLYGLIGKRSIDFWRLSASFKQNPGQATGALSDGCGDKPSAGDPLFAYGHEDMMQFFVMMKCLLEESCNQHSIDSEKWIQLSRVACEIYGQLGYEQNLLRDHLAFCRESEEDYFADAENSSCESSYLDSVPLSDSKDLGASNNGNGGTHGDELKLYSDPRCNSSYVDSTAISQLEATGQGSECKSSLPFEKVVEKEGQDPRPTNISACEKVESWLQSVCSANGLPGLSPGVPESLDTVHNSTLTLLNGVESARAILEGREKKKRDTYWWNKTRRHEGNEGEEQTSSRDWAKKDYKVEKWLKIVCAANGLSDSEATSFLSGGVPSSVESAHDDELLLLKDLETVRAHLLTVEGKKDVRPCKGKLPRRDEASRGLSNHKEKFMTMKT